MNKNIRNLLRFITILGGFVATFMILLPALSTANSDITYSGLQVSFGHNFISLGGFGSGSINFTFFNLLAYSLPVIASLLLLFTKKGVLSSTFVFGAAVVLLFFVPEFTNITVDILGNSNTISVDWTYAYGLIAAIILSAFAFAIGIYTNFVVKT